MHYQKRCLIEKRNNQEKMSKDLKEDEANVKRCESCLQILDPEIPLPSVKLLSIKEILESSFVDEKEAVLDPKVIYS